MSTAERLRQRRAEDKAAGRCTFCHTRPAKLRRDGTPSVRCARCTAKHRAWSVASAPLRQEQDRRIRASRKQRGLCLELPCKGKALEGFLRCARCLEVRAERQRESRARKAQARKNLTPAQVDQLLGVNQRTA